ncbi:hypothetical protein GV792_04950 [Nocardia cyriacigeorgica]|uniref:hypothetical protein n=1 Tax=Nocardia cyriacigeorgica TaxID=135487 RepID=UPI0013B90571|nr:hypothetical protein [Nocardia cyriacigeorgica]NEW49392.1 hypothetical protein [Nocardia cyriacigeorgica]
MLITSVAYLFGAPDVDQAIDQRQLFGFANVSDLTHVVLVMTAWWAAGIAWLRVIRRHRYVKGPYDPYRAPRKGRYARAVRAWSLFAASALATALVAWLSGNMSRTEVMHMFQLHDTPTLVYGTAYLSMLAMTSLLGLTACAAAWGEDDAPRFWLGVMASSAMCGAALALLSATMLLLNPEWLRDRFFDLVEALTAPALILLAVGAAVILWHPRPDDSVDG